MTRRYPPQPAKRIPVPGEKDASGAYVPRVKDLSIDGLLKQGLEALFDIMEACRRETSTGNPSREVVQNLKDVMAMLAALKESERDMLDELSDEDLEKAANSDN